MIKLFLEVCLRFILYFEHFLLKNEHPCITLADFVYQEITALQHRNNLVAFVEALTNLLLHAIFCYCQLIYSLISVQAP